MHGSRQRSDRAPHMVLEPTARGLRITATTRLIRIPTILTGGRRFISDSAEGGDTAGKQHFLGAIG